MRGTLAQEHAAIAARVAQRRPRFGARCDPGSIRHREPDHSAEASLLATQGTSINDYAWAVTGPFIAQHSAGSTSWEHSRGLHMSHQKRDNLLEGRVRDTSA